MFSNRVISVQIFGKYHLHHSLLCCTFVCSPGLRIKLECGATACVSHEFLYDFHVLTIGHDENGQFLTPRSVSWNIEFDREWLKNLLVRVPYQQREGTREFILDPLDSQTSSSSLLLSNGGSSRYREFQVTTRYTFHGRDEVNASYVRSRLLAI